MFTSKGGNNFRPVSLDSHILSLGIYRCRRGLVFSDGQTACTALQPNAQGRSERARKEPALPRHSSSICSAASMTLGVRLIEYCCVLEPRGSGDRWRRRSRLLPLECGLFAAPSAECRLALGMQHATVVQLEGRHRVSTRFCRGGFVGTVLLSRPPALPRPIL